MPEPTPQPPSPRPEAPPDKPIPFDIGEEFGTAKKTLPPVKIVIGAVAVVAVIVGIVSFLQRSRSSASGTIDHVESAEIEGQGATMLAINVSITNHGKNPYKLHSISVELETGGTSHTDEAASSVDFDRYLQALPSLKAVAIEPLKVDSRIAPEDTLKGTILASFPIDAAAVANRKALRVTISADREPVPLVISQEKE